MNILLSMLIINGFAIAWLLRAHDYSIAGIILFLTVLTIWQSYRNHIYAYFKKFNYNSVVYYNGKLWVVDIIYYYIGEFRMTELSGDIYLFEKFDSIKNMVVFASIEEAMGKMPEEFI